MNLRALKYFVAIADAGSVTAAAEAIAIAQPALSRQLRELESDLGLQLLHRTPRGVRLTQAGVILYESATRILTEAQRVREQLKGQRHAGQATVVLGASPTLARLLVPGVFARCQRSLNGVNLTVREAFTPVLLDGLERGMIDMALVTNPEPGRAFTMHALLGEPFALITPAGSRLGSAISISQLAHIPVLMTAFHRGIVERQLAPLGGRLNVQSEIDSIDSIRELVLQGQGATLMPVSVFKEPRVRNRVTMSEVSGVQLNRLLVMATRIEREENACLSVLKDLVISELSQLTQAGMFNFAPLRHRAATTRAAAPSP
ncbi:MAG TPA: LysR family transcriptional regulator [Herbaspirillum sp.]|nr:LysR family transcriptional regulator [Herbaspirillum sp.]